MAGGAGERNKDPKKLVSIRLVWLTPCIAWCARANPPTLRPAPGGARAGGGRRADSCAEQHQEEKEGKSQCQPSAPFYPVPPRAVPAGSSRSARCRDGFGGPAFVQMAGAARLVLGARDSTLASNAPPFGPCPLSRRRGVNRAGRSRARQHPRNARRKRHPPRTSRAPSRRKRTSLTTARKDTTATPKCSSCCLTVASFGTQRHPHQHTVRARTIQWRAHPTQHSHLPHQPHQRTRSRSRLTQTPLEFLAQDELKKRLRLRVGLGLHERFFLAASASTRAHARPRTACHRSHQPNGSMGSLAKSLGQLAARSFESESHRILRTTAASSTFYLHMLCAPWVGQGLRLFAVSA